MHTDDLSHYLHLQPLADPTIALDFLLAAKNGVRNCAIALTESGTPEIRTMLRLQLDQAIQLHEEIAQLMISKGWFHPYDINEQFKLDIVMSQTATQIAQMNLFPDKLDTSAGRSV